MCIFALYTIYTKVYILFVQQNQINKLNFYSYTLHIQKKILFLKKFAKILAYMKKLLYLCPVFRVESLAIELGRG